MSAIRDACDALADALEVAVAGKATAEPTSGKKPSKKAAITRDQVREALIELNTEHGKEAVMEILSRFSITKIGDLPEEHFAECLENVQNYEPEPEPEAEEDDPLADDDAETEPEDEPAPKRKRNRAK